MRIDPARFEALPGRIGFYFRDLTTGEESRFNAGLPIEAASVIKLAVMVEFFRQIRDNMLDPDEKYTVRENEKLPSCGALTYLDGEITVSLYDLCTLMIILSDNTATNILIRKLGMSRVNECITREGITGFALNRLLFDGVAAGHGIKNYVTADGCGSLLGRLCSGSLVSPDASEKMLGILENQRLNGKIPFFLHTQNGVTVAHKTGEDEGITHDVGIVKAEKPFIVCFLSEHTDVPRFERLIQDISYELYTSLNTQNRICNSKG